MLGMVRSDARTRAAMVGLLPSIHAEILTGRKRIESILRLFLTISNRWTMSMDRLTGKSLGILLIAHGSRNARANDDLLTLAERFRGRGFPITEGSFLELAKPDVLEGGRRCVEQGANIVVLLPYFLSAGVHVVDDLMGLKNEMRAAFPSVEFLLAKPLGPHTLLEKLLDVRLHEALGYQESFSEPDKSKIVSSSNTSLLDSKSSEMHFR